MAQKIYPFTTPGNYVYDGGRIEVVGGVARLKQVVSPPITRFRSFDNPANFSYDTNEIEVVGGVARLKNLQQALPEIVVIDYNTPGSYNASFVNAGQNKTGNNGAGSPLVAGGELDLSSAATDQWVFYDCAGYLPAPTDTGGNQSIAISFGCRLNYTGTPGGASTERPLFVFQTNNLSDNSHVYMFHQGGGGGPLFVKWKDADDAVGQQSIQANYSHPSAGAFVEFTVVMDYNGLVGFNNTSYMALYINGTLAVESGLIGSLNSNLKWDGLTRLRIGRAREGQLGNHEFSAMWVDYLTVRPGPGITPTAPSTFPVWNQGAFPSTPYPTTPRTITMVDDLIDESASPGINLITSLTLTNNLPALTGVRYVVSRDGGTTWYWHNGSTFVLSTSTFAEANTGPGLIALLTELIAFATVTDRLRFRMLPSSTDGQATPEADYIETVHNTNGYDPGNPDIFTNDLVLVTSLTNFVETVNKSGSDDVRYQLVCDGQNKWWNGSAWVNASGYAETNSAADILTNIASFLNLSVGSCSFKVRAFLHSENGVTTPELDSLTVDFNPDNFTPSLVSYDPGQNEIGIPLIYPISITFNEAIDPATALQANFFLMDEETFLTVPLVGNPTLSNGDKTLTITALDPLIGARQYSVHITNGIQDTSGNAFQGFSYTFVTEVPVPADVNRCFIYRTERDILGQPIEGMDIIVEPLFHAEVTANNVAIFPKKVVVTTDQNGTWQMNLPWSSEFSPPVDFKMTQKFRGIEKVYTFTVPNENDKPFNDLV